MISKVEHFQFGPTLAVQATVSATEKVWLAYRYDKDAPFKMVEMFDDSKNNDQMAGDGIWGVTLDWKPGTNYYIVAEGERSARLSPERASFEFYEVK